MSIEFKLPALGENVESGDVTRILVKVGDTIQPDQSVLEMETGKATVEVPSTTAGVVRQIHVKEGAKVKVGDLILTLDAAPAGAAPPKIETPKPAAAAKPTPAPAPAPAPAAPRPAPVIAPVAPPPVAAADAGRAAVPAAPSTRQFAREIGVDIQQVPGTGPGGRISIEDVKRHARSVRAPGPAPGRVAPPLPDFSKWGEIERLPINNIRQTTAEHLSASWNTIPHVTLHDKADLTALDKLRKDSKARAEAAGAKLTALAFLIKIAAAALKKFPAFNASLDLARGEMIQRKYAHIGVAVDTERGLVVPVVRDADKKNVIQIAGEVTQLSEKVRARKISPDDLQGGCFTITNLGSIGGGFFTPIINYPEAAILGVGRAATEPVFRDGFFQPRLLLPLSLSFDHRIVDGADGARFLRWLIEAIEQPSLLSLEG